MISNTEVPTPNLSTPTSTCGTELRAVARSGSRSRRLVTTFVALVLAATSLTMISGATNRAAGAQTSGCTWAQASSLAPGSRSGVADQGVVAFKGKLYLSGQTNLGNEPVTFDGSTYRLLRNINRGRISSIPNFKAVTRSKVYFTARTTQHGRELWATDGTAAGTRMVKEFTAGSNSTFFREFEAVGDTMFFTIRNSRGFQLWKTNGTGRTTQLLRRFPLSSQPDNLVRAGNKVVFGADDRAAGSELWVSNGTRRGTRRLADINPGSADSNARPFTTYRGRAYFTAFAGAGRPNLFSTDGTRAGTRAIADLDPTQRVVKRGVVDATVMGGRLHLWVSESSSISAGVDLWITNGTQRGTRPVFNANAQDFFPRSNPQTTASNGWIFYPGENPATGREWYAVKPGVGSFRTNINPGAGDASIPGTTPVAYKGSVYVVAKRPDTGTELFRLTCPR